MHSHGPGILFYELTNVLLLLSWVAIAVMLWRVRHLRLLYGGCPVVVATLISYACIRLGILLGYQPWNIPVVVAVSAGLTCISAFVITSALAKIAKTSPAPALDVRLTEVLPDGAAKMYASIKKNEEA